MFAQQARAIIAAMVDFIESLPLWLIKTLALLMGLAFAVAGGLLLSRVIRKLAAKMPKED